MNQSIVERISSNFETFQALLDTADHYLRFGDLDSSATYARMAAKFAAGQHPGMFASRRLELLLQRIGLAITGSAPSVHTRVTSSGPFPRRVLHVLTGVSGIGGHTRMLWRWIDWDSGRNHSVAVTSQGAAEVPGQLLDIVRRAGGNVHLLDSGRGGYTSRARKLRELASRADLVVLHVDPDDVTPSLAFAHSAGRPRVAYVNHADQFFWVGVGISDTLINLRTTGAHLSLHRRGIPEHRFALLPIPVPPTTATLRKCEARQRIGVPGDAIVLLSIARPHKFAQVDGVSYLDAILPVLREREDVWLIAVGAGEDDAWRAARSQVGERVRAEGIRDDTLPYYLAADVYIDSYPVASITSLLEAGSLGLPLVSRHPDSTGDTVFSADTPALERVVLEAASPCEFQDLVRHLIQDAAERHCAGDRTRQCVQSVHGREGWSSALDCAYQRIELNAAGNALSVRPDECVFECEDVLLPVLFPREPNLELVMRFSARHLPLLPRLRLLKQLRGRGQRINPGLALSHYRATQFERALIAIQTRRTQHERRVGA